jgi:FeS assembly protein IscX
VSTTTFSWADLEGLVDALRAAHPRVDPRALDDAELAALVEGLDGFDAGAGPDAGPGDYEALRAIWHWGA